MRPKRGAGQKTAVYEMKWAGRNSRPFLKIAKTKPIVRWGRKATGQTKEEVERPGLQR